MKKTKSYIFTKILLVAVVIFIGLAMYAYNMINEEKESSYRNRTISGMNMPMPHPPLTQRDEKEDNPTRDEIVNLELNSSLEKNTTRNIPEGAEYISPEEQLERETNLSKLQNEELSDDQIIPQDEVDNYEDAITIPMPENTAIPTSVNPFNDPSLGTPIGTQNNQEHPSLGTPIGDSPSSPF